MVSTCALIAARMGSSRFPGKSLSKIDDKPMLEILAKRLLCSKYIGQTVIATTKSKEDDAIEDWCKSKITCAIVEVKNDVLKRLFRFSRTL